MKRFILFVLCVCVCTNLFAQSFAINTDGSTANNSALLDIKSTTKGLLIPRMNKTQRNAIATPANGLLIYQNAPDSTGFYFYDGSAWVWLSNPAPANAWNINGNSGTNPASNYIGTSDNNDLSFGVNGLFRMRLSGESALGIGEMFPKYPLDISTGQAGINNCTQTGMRVKNIGTISNNCDLGFLFGYNDPFTNSNDAVVWNYGNNPGNNSKNIIFGLGGFERMRLNSNGFLGLGNTSPSYTLDVKTGTAAVNPCTRNGLRLDVANAFFQCERGLFLGFDDGINNRSTSLWNFGDVTNPANDLFLRVGFGDPAAPGNTLGGEVMRILPPGKGVGVGTTNPLAMLHITNYTGVGALPGLMVTSPALAPGSMGFYTGLRVGATPNDGYVWNYQNAAVKFGSDDLERMRIQPNGNVGINTTNPLAILHVADSSVLFSAGGTVPASPANVPVSGAGRRMMWYPEKAAFRVGYVDGVNWDKDSIGNYSFAAGYDGRAKGISSISMGKLALAYADYTTTIGPNTVAIANYATAIGNFAYAQGLSSVAIGTAAYSAGDYSMAIGANAITATGALYSIAAGYNSVTSGQFSTATGNSTFTFGYNSFTAGFNTWAKANASFCIGAYNNTADSPDPVNEAATDRLFQIGNGTSSSRSNALTVLRNGNMGIGVLIPLERLHVSGNIRSTTLAGVGNRLTATDANGTFINIAAGSNGQVLAMVAGAPAWSANTSWSTLGNTGTSAVTNFIGTTDGIDFVLRTTNTERMRITAGGNVGIGTTNPAKQTEIIGAASATPVTLVIGNRGGFGPAAMEFVSDYGTGNQWRPGYIRSNDIGGFTGALEFYTNGTGAGNLYGNVKGLEVRNAVTYTATGTVSSFSDERIKNNVQPFTSGLDIINQINPVSFYYNEKSPFQTGKMQIGIIAQDLEKVAPYMVDQTATKDFEDLRSVNNQAYIFLLINAVKELQKEVEELKNKNK